ncbi:NAD(P)-dependent oxidoreductase [Clostridiaceae bacterium 35-E11]
MKIVVIDDVLMNQEQIELLKGMGELNICSGVPANEEEILKRAENADIIINGWTNFSKDVLGKLPNLKMISLWATGYDHVDIAAAHKRGITVTNIPGYAKNAVAELAVSLMLAVMRKVPQADRDVRESKAYHWGLFQGMELSNKTLGVLGTGVIGCRVIEIASGFNMKIIAYDPKPKDQIIKKYNVRYVSCDEIFLESDVVSVHMPLLPSTKHLITTKNFNQMKKNGIFINTARADLINQDDLYQTLKNKNIFGAGLDDIDLTIQSGIDLLKLDNVVVTPHMGFNTREAIVTKTNICIDNIQNYLNGKSSNEVYVDFK